MNIYIDTNTWFSYLKPGASVKTLGELKRLLNKRKIKLLVPQQMRDEYLKHVASIIEQHRKSSSSEAFQTELDKLSNKADDKLVANKLLALSKLVKTNTKKAKDIAEIYMANADKQIMELLAMGEVLEVTDDILHKARIRFDRGKPPRKDKDMKYGDAIIWETILAYTDVSNPLMIVTNDPDFTEPAKKGRVVHRLLDIEWRQHSDKQLTIESSLSEFVNSVAKKKKPIKQEVVEEEKKTQGFSSFDPRQFALARLSQMDTPPLSSVFAVSTNEPVYYSIADNMNTLSAQLSGGFGGSITTTVTFCPYCGNPINKAGVLSSIYTGTASNTHKCLSCGKTFKLSS